MDPNGFLFLQLKPLNEMIFRFCQIVPDKISDKFTEGIFCIRSSIRVALNGNPLGAKKTPLGRMKVNIIFTNYSSSFLQDNSLGSLFTRRRLPLRTILFGDRLHLSNTVWNIIKHHVSTYQYIKREEIVHDRYDNQSCLTREIVW